MSTVYREGPENVPSQVDSVGLQRRLFNSHGTVGSSIINLCISEIYSVLLQKMQNKSGEHFISS